MAAIITYHQGGASPRFGSGHEMPVRPRQTGNSESLAVSGTAANGTVAEEDCIARVLVEDDCWIVAGKTAIATVSNGMPLVAGDVEEFSLRAGERISVIAR